MKGRRKNVLLFAPVCVLTTTTPRFSKHSPSVRSCLKNKLNNVESIWMDSPFVVYQHSKHRSKEHEQVLDIVLKYRCLLLNFEKNVGVYDCHCSTNRKIGNILKVRIPGIRQKILEIYESRLYTMDFQFLYFEIRTLRNIVLSLF